MYDVHIFSPTTLAPTTNILYIYYPSKFENSFLHSKESTHCFYLHKHQRTKELPNNCLPGQKQGRQCCFSILPSHFPATISILAHLPLCPNQDLVVTQQFSWKQNAPWSVGDASVGETIRKVRTLMPGELKCLSFEMSWSKYL